MTCQSPRRRHAVLELVASRSPAPKPTGEVSELGPASDRECLVRARADAAKHPASVQGEGGDTNGFVLAARLGHNYALSDEQAVELMSEEWNPRCSPEFSESQLATLVRNGQAYAKGVYGDLREPPISDYDHTLVVDPERNLSAKLVAANDTEWGEPEAAIPPLEAVEQLKLNMLPAPLARFVGDIAERMRSRALDSGNSYHRRSVDHCCPADDHSTKAARRLDCCRQPGVPSLGTRLR